MSSIIEKLPTELLTEILTFLRINDLSKTCLVSRGFQQIAEPILWTRVELHSPLYHEDYSYDSLRQDEVALQRPYHQLKEVESKVYVKPLQRFLENQEMERIHADKAEKFLLVFQENYMHNQQRVDYLASLIKWLCLSIESSEWESRPDAWNILAMFRNLEYLEVRGYWSNTEQMEPFKESGSSMLNIHTLKLRGYIPAGFVNHVCQGVSSITNLHLALLDAPIGSARYNERENSPPPIPEYPEGYEGMTEEEMDALDDVESFNGEEVAARPLACLSPTALAQLSALTHLHLCKPTEPNYSNEWWRGMYFSAPADKRILQEWASLLRASRKSLTHVRLDQRPVASEIELDSTDNAEFIVGHSYGPSYDRFVEIVLPIFLEDADWPRLRSIQLFGFELDERDLAKVNKVSSFPIAPTRHGVDLVKQLERKFPEADIASELGRRIIMHDWSGVVGHSADVLEDGGSFDW
ncbi:hypothetical protein CC78DRAFT_564081 [Lojkania enalia]|uniref:F-box domain-containing protein n=1 Tax=Lojkania enalia TaxID=147567 RepID=A0A9P4TQR2_9PLEO|nr:hypothetical protein CC78DRAFT_564081 [Didymosphaeria enalia]